MASQNVRTFEVTGTFVVEAESVEAAQELVAREVNGRLIQRYIGEFVGPVHLVENGTREVATTDAD